MLSTRPIHPRRAPWACAGATKPFLPMYTTTSRPELGKAMGFVACKVPCPFGPADGAEGFKKNEARLGPCGNHGEKWRFHLRKWWRMAILLTESRISPAKMWMSLGSMLDEATTMRMSLEKIGTNLQTLVNIADMMKTGSQVWDWPFNIDMCWG